MGGRREKEWEMSERNSVQQRHWLGKKEGPEAEWDKAGHCRRSPTGPSISMKQGEETTLQIEKDRRLSWAGLWKGCGRRGSIIEVSIASICGCLNEGLCPPPLCSGSGAHQQTYLTRQRCQCTFYTVMLSKYYLIFPFPSFLSNFLHSVLSSV